MLEEHINVIELHARRNIRFVTSYKINLVYVIEKWMDFRNERTKKKSNCDIYIELKRLFIIRKKRKKKFNKNSQQYFFLLSIFVHSLSHCIGTKMLREINNYLRYIKKKQKYFCFYDMMGGK